MKKNASIITPLFTLIVFGMLVASKFAESYILQTGGNAYLTVIILNVLIFIIPTLIFCRIKGVGYSKKMNIGLFAPSQFGAILLSTLFLICGSALIRYAQVYLLGLTTVRYSIFNSYINAMPSASMLPLAMAFAVVPAISEELVFRTIVLTEYNYGGYGAVPASIGSVVLSSILCLDLEILPIYVMLGIVCCMITYATGSSLTAVIVHVLFNCYEIFGEKYVFNAVSNPANRVTSVFAIGALFLIFSALMFADFERILKVSSVNGTPVPAYVSGEETDAEQESVGDEAPGDVVGHGGISRSFSGFIEIMFSPTMLISVLIFLIMIFGFN
ncbi:MAG: CPBP family intramembrane metalloprotease [Clostridia bacterium]|nr:CPBP family intramembrane metalloprotease [Clostridia bacterium]